MSFAAYKDNIEYGDIAILYFSPSHIAPLKISSGQTLQTAYGAIKHSDLIGKRYGSRINCAKGYLHILHPTSELWTQAVPHRTQILYSTDISMITFQLELTAGSVVVEAGTGSGSLSHAIIRSVMPNGHLFTFEFHKERFQKAAQEFIEHGLSDNVTCTHRDVCIDGFQLDHVADAVFLDLPAPWSCIESAKQALKLQGGRICSFSPCIEQVSQTCSTLADQDFHDIKTLECLVRKLHVKHTGQPKANLGELTQSEKCHQAKIEPSRANVANTSQAVGIFGGQEVNMFESVVKKPKMEEDNANNSSYKGKKKGQDSYEFVTAAPVQDMQGHTGFLTFATLYSQ